MTTDEILTEYENVWRAMALDGVPQFYGPGADGIPGGMVAGATCAFVARWDAELRAAASRVPGPWRCQEPSCTWEAGALANAMIHVNNAHHWTFARFAKDFREAWLKGIAA